MDDQKIEPKPITLQKQYDDSYTYKSNSIATSYQNAYKSYTTKSTAVSTANKNTQDTYDGEKSIYDGEKATYDNLKSMQDSQIAQQKALDDAAKASMQAIQNSVKIAPSRFANNVSVSGLKDREAYVNQFTSQGTQNPNWYNGSDNINFSFDADVSNLKKGDVLSILDLDLRNETNPNTNAPFSGWIMDMGTTGMPLMVNGKQYGTIYAKVHDRYSNEWIIGGSFARADHANIYAIINDDVPGVGNQHFDFKSTGNLTINYMGLPSDFAGHDVSNYTVTFKAPTANDSGKIIGVEHEKFHQLTPSIWNTTQNNGVEMHPESDNNQSFWSRVFDMTQVLKPGGYPAWINSGFKSGTNIQDYYFLNMKISNSTGFMITEDQPYPIQADDAIQAEVQPRDSNGNFLDNGDVNSTRNKPDDRMDYDHYNKYSHYLADGLTIQQLHQQAADYIKGHPTGHGSQVFFSKQDNNTYLSVAVATKQAFQNALKKKLEVTGEGSLRNASWNINADKDPNKSYQNTIDYLKSSSLDGLSQWNAWGHMWFNYGDPTVVNKQHFEQLDDNGNIIQQTDSQSTPYQQMHSGQSGIRVHYLNGDTGMEMRRYNWSIADAGTDLTVDPQLVVGYELKVTPDVKGLPAGATTIESTQTIKYPAQGQWKDVYVVYHQFIPGGHLTPPTPPVPPTPQPGPTPPTKETVEKQIADVSYHSNTVYRKNNAK